MMHTIIKYLMNGGLFYVGWFVAMTGATFGYGWLGPLFLAPWLVLHLCYFCHRHHELIFIGIVTAAGFAIDTLYLRTGVLTYASPNPLSPLLCPPWILSIYAMYAMTINHSLKWLRHQRLLAIPLGAFGGTITYVAGERIHAVEFLLPKGWSPTVIAVVWAVMLPASYWLMDHITRE